MSTGTSPRTGIDLRNVAGLAGVIFIWLLTALVMALFVFSQGSDASRSILTRVAGERAGGAEPGDSVSSSVQRDAPPRTPSAEISPEPPSVGEIRYYAQTLMNISEGTILRYKGLQTLKQARDPHLATSIMTALERLDEISAQVDKLKKRAGKGQKAQRAIAELETCIRFYRQSMKDYLVYVRSKKPSALTAARVNLALAKRHRLATVKALH